MINLPLEVSRKIAFNNLHPITAWRHYFGITKQELANYLNMKKSQIDLLERSNLHLESKLLNSLCKLFGVYPEAISIRYKNADSSGAIPFCNNIFKERSTINENY